MIAPVFVLLFALGVLYRLGQAGTISFDVSKLFSDLPSLFALLIVVTICLLPLAGLPVPDVLSTSLWQLSVFILGNERVRRAEARET